MTFDNHRNFAFGAVLLAPSPALSGTSLKLQLGQGQLFPAAPFNLVVFPANSQPNAVNAEIVRVTGVAGDVLTIERAQEGTTAKAISVGWNASANTTAKVFTDMESGLNELETDLAGALTGANAYADAAAAAALAAANAYTDDEVDGILAAANGYTDSAVASALMVANSYTNSQIALTLLSANAYADSAASQAVSLANTHSDANDVVTLTAANNYTNQQMGLLSGEYVALDGSNIMTGPLRTPYVEAEYLWLAETIGIRAYSELAPHLSINQYLAFLPDDFIFNEEAVPAIGRNTPENGGGLRVVWLDGESSGNITANGRFLVGELRIVPSVGSTSGVLKCTAGVVGGSSTTSDLTEGSNLYFTGARVLATQLTGYVNGDPDPIDVSDTVLQAFGKAQSQINDRLRITGTVPLTINTGAVVVSTPILNLSQTWNFETNFTALKLNITDSNSEVNSVLMDLQVGGASKLKVNKSGSILMGQNVDNNKSVYDKFCAMGQVDLGDTNSSSITIGALSDGDWNQYGYALIRGGITGSTSFDCYVSQDGGNTEGSAEYGFSDSTNPKSAALYIYDGSRGVCNIRPGLTGGSDLSINSAVLFDTSFSLSNAKLLTIKNNNSARLVIDPTGDSVITPVWNSGGTVFTALKVNVTDTASNAASLLMDLQVGGASRMSVAKDGTVTIAALGGFTTAAVKLGGINTGWSAPANYRMDGIINGTQMMSFDNRGGSNAACWVGGGSSAIMAAHFWVGANDTILTRDAANILALRNSTNAQTLRVYGTYTDASNYERGVLGIVSGRLTLTTEAAGTGTYRDIDIRSGGQIRLSTTAGSGVLWLFNASGHFLAQTDNTLDIGANGANRPRYGYFGSGVTAGDYLGATRILFTGQGIFRTQSDGVFLLQNAAGNDFNRLQFGLTTAAAPAIKRSGTGLHVRLADDSAFSTLTASTLTANTGVITANTPAVDIEQTWNNAAIQFMGLQLNVTDDASHVDSTLLNLQVDGFTKLKVNKNGAILWGQNIDNNRNGSDRLSFFGQVDLGDPTTSGLTIGALADDSWNQYGYFFARAGTAGVADFGICIAPSGANESNTTLGFWDATDLNTMYLQLYKNGTSEGVYFLPGIADGGGATAFKFNSYNSLVSGSLLSVSNNTSVRLVISGPGNLTLTPTWNSGVTDFVAFKVNVTEIDGGANSKLMDLQFGSASRVTASKTGQVRAWTNNINSPAYGFLNANVATAGFGWDTLGSNRGAAYHYAGAALHAFTSGGFQLANTIALSWSANGDALGTTDLILVREAANVMALRNGANVQTLRVYSTYTDASNYKRVTLHNAGADGYVGLEAAGSGNTTGDFYVSAGGAAGSRIYTRTAGTIRWQIDGDGHLLPFTTATYTIGTASARTGNVYSDGFLYHNGGGVKIQIGGGAAQVTLSNDAYIAFTNSSTAPNTKDLYLYRDDVGILAMRNGANAESLRIYNTYTDSSNYERLLVGGAGSSFYVATQAAGTGAARDLILQAASGAEIQLNSNGGSRWKIDVNGSFVAQTDNAYHIGMNGVSRPGNIYFAGALVGNARTITSDEPLVNLSQTWNNAAIAFTAFKMDVTDTASAAASLLADFQVGGSSKVSITKAGVVNLLAGGNTTGLGFANSAKVYGVGSGASANLWLAGGSGDNFIQLNSGVDGRVGFGSSSDAFLLRDAANTIAQRNSTNAQAFRVYNTYTSGSVYERATMEWTGNIFSIRTEHTGGTNRAISLVPAGEFRFGAGGSETFKINTSGHLVATSDNAFDIGASGATRPRNLYVGTSGNLGSCVVGPNNIMATAGGYFFFSSRTRLSSASDGNLLLDNSAGTDFGRLQFGLTTSAAPAIKRSGAALHVRLADDSAYALLSAKSIHYNSSTHTYNANMAIDFDGDRVKKVTSVTGTIAWTTTGRDADIVKTITYRLTCDSSAHNMTFPAWKWAGTAPTQISANAEAILVVTCFGSAETDVVASYKELS